MNGNLCSLFQSSISVLHDIKQEFNQRSNVLVTTWKKISENITENNSLFNEPGYQEFLDFMLYHTTFTIMMVDNTA